MTPAEIQRELDELETRLERLRIKYDQYFTGIEKMLPFVARKDVDRRFQSLHREQMRNTSLRFRFQTLVQRFTAYQTYWGRIIRQIEDGTYRRDVVRAQRLGMRIPGRNREDPNSPQELDADALEELEPEAAPEESAPALTSPGLDEPAPSRQRPVAPPLENANEPSVAQPFPQRDSEEFNPPPRAITPPPRAPASLPAPQIAPAPRAPLAAPVAASPAAASPAAPQAPSTAGSSPATPAVTAPAAATGFAPRAPGQIPAMQPVQRPPALGGRTVGSATGSTPPGPPGPPGATRGFVPPRPPGMEGPVKPPGPMGTVAPRLSQPTPTQPPAPSPSQPVAPRVSQPSIPPRVSQPSLPPRPSAAPGGDDPAMRQLYDRYVAARKQTGESSEVRFETVAKQVKETLPRLAEKYQDADVRLDVAIKDGKAILRPVVTMRKKPGT